MPLKVIGAGLGRTGTRSLKLALEHLGFARCYHMFELLSDHPDHIASWHGAATGAPPDWEHLFDGYQAAVDWPVCAFWRELADAYPDAAVVLTVRDPSSWYESFVTTIRRGIAGDTAPAGDDWLRMAQAVVFDRTLGTASDDREQLVAAFERHNRAVIDRIPPERLLVYEVADGWAPLCNFLGVPEPAQAFPRENDRAAMLQMMNAATSPVGPPAAPAS